MRTANQRRFVRLRAGLGAALVAVVVAGCSSGPDSGNAAASPTDAPSSSASGSPSGTTPAQDAFERVAATAETAKQAGAANIALEIVSTGAGETVRVTSVGVNDAATGSARLSTEVSQPGLEPVTAETIVVDGVLYLGGLPDQPADTWLRVPVDQAQQFGVDGSSADPSQTLQLLGGVSKDVAEVGTEELRGVAVTRYAGTIDVAEALAAMPAAQAELVGPIYAESGITAIPFELSVDDQGRPAKLTQTLALTIEGESVLVETTVEFFDWGTDADITAPDPAQVVDAVEAPAPTA